MPYFRNNRFGLFNRERRKATIYFHMTTSSRWFGQLVASWRSKLPRLSAIKIKTLARAKTTSGSKAEACI